VYKIPDYKKELVLASSVLASTAGEKILSPSRVAEPDDFSPDPTFQIV
jgi:hypothetical protein